MFMRFVVRDVTTRLLFLGFAFALFWRASMLAAKACNTLRHIGFVAFPCFCGERETVNLAILAILIVFSHRVGCLLSWLWRQRLRCACLAFSFSDVGKFWLGCTFTLWFRSFRRCRRERWSVRIITRLEVTGRSRLRICVQVLWFRMSRAREF